MPAFDLERLNYELSRLNHKLGIVWPYPDAKEYILLIGDDEYNVLDRLCTSGFDNTVRDENGQILNMFGFPILRVNRPSYLKAVYNPTNPVVVIILPVVLDEPAKKTDKQVQAAEDLTGIWQDPPPAK